MSNWTEDTLEAIIEEDDLHIAPYRADQSTYGTPTWIWCVSHQQSMYMRAYSGQKSSWYQAAMKQQGGRIKALEQNWEVHFAPVKDATLLDAIDKAYNQKYAGSNYLKPMVSSRARNATVLVKPASQEVDS